jgi:DNA-binding NarL/FixJ family response regulator
MLGIQIVEEDSILRNKIKEIISSSFNDAFVLNASGHNECLHQLTEHPIDVIVMDIRLKTENGLPLIKRIKHRVPEAFIIIHSMYDSQEYIRAAKNYGANVFLSKNFNSIGDMISLIKCISEKSSLKPVTVDA